MGLRKKKFSSNHVMVQVVVTRGRRVVNNKKPKAKKPAVDLERCIGGGESLDVQQTGV